MTAARLREIMRQLRVACESGRPTEAQELEWARTLRRLAEIAGGRAFTGVSGRMPARAKGVAP